MKYIKTEKEMQRESITQEHIIIKYNGLKRDEIVDIFKRGIFNDKLNKIQREMIQLRFIENVTFYHLAEKLGVSHQAAMKLYHKAFRILILNIVNDKQRKDHNVYSLPGDTNIQYLNLSVRIVNVLRRNGVETLNKLKELASNLESLRKIRGLGEKGIDEIYELFYKDAQNIVINSDYIYPKSCFQTDTTKLIVAHIEDDNFILLNTRTFKTVLMGTKKDLVDYLVKNSFQPGKIMDIVIKPAIN